MPRPAESALNFWILKIEWFKSIWNRLEEFSSKDAACPESAMIIFFKHKK